MTPTQCKLLDLLSDGKLHSKAEMLKLLPDDAALRNTLVKHVSAMRTELKASGFDVAVERGKGYRLVRLLHSTSD